MMEDTDLPVSLVPAYICILANLRRTDGAVEAMVIEDDLGKAKASIK